MVWDVLKMNEGREILTTLFQMGHNFTRCQFFALHWKPFCSQIYPLPSLPYLKIEQFFLPLSGRKKIFSSNISWLSNFQVVKKSWSGSRVQQLQDKNFEWYCQNNPRLQRILFMQLRCSQMLRVRGKIANPCVWPKIKDHTPKCLHPSRINYLTPPPPVPQLQKV